MARRRLTPAEPQPGQDVPRAERPRSSDALLRLSPHPPAAAPIARVAAEAAGAAALQEMADSLHRARDGGRMVLDLPIAAIAPDHLMRDRLPADGPEMAELRASLRAHGQRTPIEVTPLDGALPYGLLSGWRRLAALKALHAETGEARFATVQALVRRPETAAAAYVGMVEENEIRVGLSQYERARVAALATRRGIFPSEDAALRALFATASRPKRSRIRAFLEIYHALDGVLRFPQALPERLGLKLVERVRAGGAGQIAEILARDAPQTSEAEAAILQALIAPPPKTAFRRLALRPDLDLEETLRGRSLTLRLRGAAVTPELAAEIRALLDRLRR